jgi:hypothetical protein
MGRVRIEVDGKADRLLVKALHEVQPILETLRGSILVIGGLMVRIWLHVEPPELPVRATADIDLGVDRHGLGLASKDQKITPLLKSYGFKPGAVDPDERFRFGKELEGETVVVDVLVAPGSSREEPPLLERGVRSLAAPGLAYALRRGSIEQSVDFYEGGTASTFTLPLPTLDAAFVLKAALAESGVRGRLDRRRVDSVDSILLAAALLANAEALSALREHQGRSDVRKALRWLATAFSGRDSIGVVRVTEYFSDEFGIDTDPEYGVRVAAALAQQMVG